MLRSVQARRSVQGAVATRPSSARPLITFICSRVACAHPERTQLESACLSQSPSLLVSQSSVASEEAAVGGPKHPARPEVDAPC